jgi:hypothetical protein
MSTLIKSQDVRTIAAGIAVARPSTATNNTPLGSGNLFTVSGGRILLVSLVGEVTTVIQGQSTTVKLTSTPTTGSAIDLSSAVGDINALEVGGRITLANPPAAATALVKTNAGYTDLPGVRTIVPIGIISVTYGAASTGALKWDLIYIPLDVGAAVVAVA